MVEALAFHFEGALADTHRMNFYEAARFQYAAARLIVKLSQYRQTGKFGKVITNRTNPNIVLVSQSDGSFTINTEDLGSSDGQEAATDLSLADLIAFVSERVIEKINAKGALQQVGLIADDFAEDEFGEGALEQLDILVENASNNLELFNGLPAAVKEIVRRRMAELYRETRMAANQAEIERIAPEDGQKLVAMAAPLFSEMATALRRSANSLEIRNRSDTGSNPLLFLDQKMARNIETAIVDRDITPILGDILQFNKDNGWGKIRIENGTKVVSFNVPYDRLSTIRQRLIDSMKRDLVYLQTYFVRDRAGELTRLIGVGILPTPSN